ARALARLANLFGLPSVQTLTRGASHQRSIVEITEEIGDETYVRSSPFTLDDPAIREALGRCRRRVLGVGGLMTEVGLLYAVLGALGLDYEVHVLVDLSGGCTHRTEHAALSRMEREGAILSSVPSFAMGMV